MLKQGINTLGVSDSGVPTFLELICHNHLRGRRNVMCSTHRRIRWRDNWHAMRPISRIKLRSLSRKQVSECDVMCTFGFHTRTGRGPSSICFNKTGSGQDLQTNQHTLSRPLSVPLPLVHDDEEPADDGTRRNVRVQLTYPRYKHGPSYTTEEPAHVGIDGPPYHFNG